MRAYTQTLNHIYVDLRKASNMAYIKKKNLIFKCLLISVRPYAVFAVPYRTFEILPYPYRTVLLPYAVPYISSKSEEYFVYLTKHIVFTQFTSTEN